MKFLLLSLLITFACAEFDLKQVESGQLFVPKDPKAFLESYKARGVVEKTRDGRIANGMNAAEGQFPYALRVSVFDTDGAIFICSGALIAPNFMLTVRHCFDPRLTFSVMGAVGSVNLNSADMVERFSDNWWFAPAIQGWNPDLAVVRLSQPFPINSRIQPIRLPSNSQRTYEFAQYPISIIGWGRNAQGNMPTILQWARFRIETNCWSNRRPTTLCSVPVDGWHVETRGGDSGGPWATIENGTPTLVALTEGSTGSQTTWWFRGTRLSSFLDFIHSVTGIPIRP